MPSSLVRPTAAAAVEFSIGGAASGLVTPGAASLAQGVTKAMILSKMKVAAAAVMTLALLSGGAAFVNRPVVMAWGAGMKASEDSKESAVSGAGEPENEILGAVGDRRSDEDLAWGEIADGLQAGVGLRVGTDGDHGLDEAVRLVVRVRNRGNVPVKVTYQSQPFDSIPPVVEADGGKRMAVVMPPFAMYKRRTLERTLNPGEVWEVGAPRIEFTIALRVNQEEESPVEVPTVAVGRAGARAGGEGTFRAWYPGFLRSHPMLSTGRLGLSIHAPPEAAQGIRGRWQATRFQIDGKPDPAEAVEKTELLIDDTSYRFAQVPPHGPRGLGSGVGTVRTDTTKVPHEIDLTPTTGVYKGLTQEGIFVVDGDTLKLCYGMPTKARPATFASGPNSGIYLAEFRRVAGSDRPAEDPAAAIADVLRAHGGEARIRSLRAFTETIRETARRAGDHHEALHPTARPVPLRDQVPRRRQGL